MNKLKQRRITRLALIGFLLFVSLEMIDYMLMKRIESLLDEQVSTFDISLETDLCNAITDAAYFGPRFFINRLLKERQVVVKFLHGECNRGQLTDLRIKHKK